MTPEEIKYLRNTLPNGFNLCRKDKIWIEAFKQFTNVTGLRYSIDCRPCYFKVLYFFETGKIMK